MGWGNLIIIIFMCYYSFYFIKLFKGKNRKLIQVANKELDKLRKIPVKSIEEQKRFLDIKHPKKRKFKWSWKIIPSFLLQILIFVIFFQIYNFLFYILGWSIPLWVAILFIIIAPIFINLILEKFKLEKSDIRIFLGWKK